MSIIKGEKVTERVLLTSTRELFCSENPMHGSFVEEECHKAFQEGVMEGEACGYERFVVETKAFLEMLTLLAHKLLEQKKKMLDQLKPEIVEFSVHVCERILRKELSQPESMAALLNSLISLCENQFKEEPLQVYLAPEDLGMLKSHLSRLSNSIHGMSFHEDVLIRRGDCRIEAKAGLLNYSISRELADLQAKILQ